VETEALTATHPPLGDAEWLAHVRSACRLHRDQGRRLLLVATTVESDADLRGVLAAVAADAHVVVRLEAPPATLARRIVEREPEGWSGLDRLVAASARLGPVIAGLDGIALALSTEDARPRDVAARIRAAFPVPLRGQAVPILPPELARTVIEAIRSGEAATLEALLRDHPGLAAARIGGPDQSRTLLHVLTDWPGNVPEAAAKIRALVAAGADVDARFTGPHTETPLHWAASSDDVEALDALLDAGAAIDAGGAVIGGGTPLADAVAFGQWEAARRLLERGARANLWQAAALGLLDRVRDELARTEPAQEELDNALWCAAHGGRRDTAALLIDRGADPAWVGHDDLTPAAAAERSEAHALAAWLRERAGER
jgi:uncharacterized protein